MASINVHVKRSETDPNFVPATLPDDQPVVDVAETVRERMGLPESQNGQPLVYYFMVKEKDNEVLRGDGSFRDAGVETGHHLTMLSEPTGGTEHDA